MKIEVDDTYCMGMKTTVSIPVIENASTEGYTAISSHARAELAVKAAVRLVKKETETREIVLLHDKANRLYAERWFVAFRSS